jgi:hypothetical protein
MNGEASVLDFLKEQVALWKFKRSPLAQAIRAHTQEYFSVPSLASFSDENKEKLIGDFCQRVALIFQSPNPTMACREALAECTIIFTKLHVHCLREQEKAEQFYSENPYISGQLWRHIRESSDHHDELSKWKWEDPELTDDDLLGYANTRCALYLYYANGMNIVRRSLGDFSEEKDWFRPFVEAMLVTHEEWLRQELKLPSLIPGDLGALEYFIFLEYVTKGVEHPFFEWARAFPETYLAGEGPRPKLAKVSG